MNRIVVLVGPALVLILGVGALSAAQDATPGAGVLPSDVCASPVGSPEATPVVLFACVTPGVGTPVTVGEAAAEASPV